MSNKEVCPVCDNYLSSIYEAFENGEKCPICKTSYETIAAFKNIETKKSHFKKIKADEELLRKITELEKELILEKEKSKRILNYLQFVSFKFNDLTDDLNKVFSEDIEKLNLSIDFTKKCPSEGLGQS